MKIYRKSSKKIKWIIGFFDSYGHNHYKIIYNGDEKDSHNSIWPGKISAHGKWRWIPSDPSNLNTYNEDLSEEEIDSIWNLVDSFR